MQITIKIGGMMCQHCVHHIEEALSPLEGVKGVEVSLEKGTATIECDSLIKEDILKKAIEDADYEYLGLQK
jgi:copper ion binding protein